MDAVSHISVPLTKGWLFKRGDRSSTNTYLPAHDAPTEVHRDLIKNHQLTDPFNDFNELSAHWVGDETWTYSTSFDATADYARSNTVTKLRFEGLDTFASVYLNGKVILESDNMFIEHQVNVSGMLKSEGNILEIVFESARKKGLELVAQHKEHRFIVHQTETSRGPVRKAQYHWGWDWGPILMTCGLWKPVSIETWTCRISTPGVQYEISDMLESAELKATVQWEGPLAALVFAVLQKDSDEIVADAVISVNTESRFGIAEATIKMDNIQLWWPRGYGNQALYTIKVEAYAELSTPAGSPLQSISQQFGFRRVELVKELDDFGESFHFRINSVDIFSGGSCWVPAESFLTRLTPEDYRAWVKLAAEGNQNMLRIWGGGVYESDALYEAADELGVLIWQDFMFACANYPAYPDYLRSVETEARQNVQRLRNHPCIVIWAGNNEDYQIVERYELDYNLNEDKPESWLKTNFPARYTYESLLPNLIREECPNVPYHPSSPFGNGKSTVLKVDPTIGDVHQWNMWHGTMEPYQRLPDMGGRFVSEFGMEAYPHVASLQECITKEENRYPGSMAMDFRNKAIGHERRLISYVAENFRIRYDLEGFTHLTQVMQADAMSWAYKSWRRDWGTANKRKCGGVLVWQLNDCWPTMSWAVVDYYRVPKPAYYAMKRSMQPITVAVQRKYKSWTMRPADELWQRDTGHIDMQQLWQDVKFDVWCANSTSAEVHGTVGISYISIKTGQEMGKRERVGILLARNATTEFLNDHVEKAKNPPLSNERFNVAEADPFIIHVTLYIEGQCVASDTSWPEPIKYLSFVDRGVKVQYSNDNTVALVSAAKPVKGFVFGEKKGVRLSDNGFDVLPGSTETVRVEGCMASELKWSYIGI